MALALAAAALPIDYRSTTTWTEADQSAGLGGIPAAFMMDAGGSCVVVTNPRVFCLGNARSVSDWVGRCRDAGLRFALMDPAELAEAERPETLAG